MRQIRKIASNQLFVSEPNPVMFGNGPNQPSKFWTNKNWLKSRFHFSFAEYSNYKNTNFGVLRVLNDDLVQPARGFGTHPHRNMEIVTYVVNGNLTHQDSMETRDTLGRGSVQFMTAGTGVHHSEHNLHPTEPLRFLQLWIVPRTSNLPPNYGGFESKDISLRKNKWQHLVTDVRNSENVPIKINQDVNIYVAELDQGSKVEFKVQEDRQVYFVCVEGKTILNGESLTQHDAAEIVGQIDLSINSSEGPSSVFIIEMSKTNDSRFTQTEM